MDRQQAQHLRPDYGNTLRLLQKRGFVPKTVLDLGAAEGAFFLTRARQGIYPDAHHFFVDAMQENEPYYRDIAEKFHASYEIAALSFEEGEAVLRVDPGFYNTHIDLVQTDSAYRETRRVRKTTLDGLVARHRLEPPFSLLIDVQGAELDVLRGATRTLAQAEVVTTEIQVFSGRDNMVQLLSFMDAAGWALYDVTNLAYFADWTFYQCYVTFIPKAREFRKASDWAQGEHLERLNEALRERRAANLRRIDEILKR